MERYNKIEIQKEIDSINKEINCIHEDYLDKNGKYNHLLTKEPVNLLVSDLLKRQEYLQIRKDILNLQHAVANLQYKELTLYCKPSSKKAYNKIAEECNQYDSQDGNGFYFNIKGKNENEVRKEKEFLKENMKKYDPDVSFEVHDIVNIKEY